MTDLPTARAMAAESRARFLKLHRECCEAFGAYCVAMQDVQTLTSSLHQPLLAGNLEAENQLSALLIKESPVAMAKRQGLEVTRGWGWDRSADVVPLVRV